MNEKEGVTPMVAATEKPTAKFIPIRDVPALDWMPPGRGGGRISEDTVSKWVRPGLKRNGEAVRLKALKVGAKWCTTERWLREFFAALTGESAPTMPGQDEVAQLRAEAVLASAGI